MALGMEVGIGPGDFVFDGDPALQEKGHSPTQFLAHVYCGRWIDQDTTNGTDVNLGPGDVVLDGATAPSFRFMSFVVKRLYG